MTPPKSENAKSHHQTTILISDMDKEFVASTSCHGISYCCIGEKKIVKITWMLLIVGMLSFLVLQVSSRITAYLDYKTTTDISEIFMPSVEFPAVTICSFSRYFERPELQNSRILSKFHALNRLISMTYASKNLNDENNKILDGFGDDFNITSHIDRHGFFIEGDVQSCRYRSEACESSDITASITSLGKCYTFNKEGRIPEQNVPGAGNGFMMVTDSRQMGYTEEPLYGSMEAGIKVQVHPRYEVPDVETYGVAIPPGRKAFINIKRSDYNLMYKPWGKCDPTKEKLKYFTKYTLHNCEQECYTKALIRECGCRWHAHHWAYNDAEACTLRQVRDCASKFLFEMKQNFSATDCNCTMPCRFTKYDVSVTYANFPSLPTLKFIMDTRRVTEEMVVKNIMSFEAYHSSMSYVVYTQSKKVDESGLISDIGGQLGLWVGMSFITFFEFIQYFIKRTNYCCRTDNVVEDVDYDDVSEER